MLIKRLLNHAGYWRDLFLDAIFPKECLGCGQEGAWLCSACQKQLHYQANQYCLNCKQPNSYGEFCPACRNDYYLDGVLIAGNYDDKIIANIIKYLKYYFVRDLGDVLGDYLYSFLTINMAENGAIITAKKFNLIIPVPLHKKRRRWRGFNQSELIAARLGEKMLLPININNLVRIKHAKAQAKLSEQARQQNIKNCFAWRGERLNGKNIFLLDDVVTTGATLNECAKVLKQKGAQTVWALVVAKG